MQFARGVLVQAEQNAGLFRKFKSTRIDRRARRQPTFDIVTHFGLGTRQNGFGRMAMSVAEIDEAMEVSPEDIEIGYLLVYAARFQELSSRSHGAGTDGRPDVERRDSAILVHEVVAHVAALELGEVFFPGIVLDASLTAGEQLVHCLGDEVLQERADFS